MKKIIRKGFSMIELLFVMVILASLAAIAIPSMSSGEESSVLTSMRSDAKNTIALLQAKYVDSQDYADVITAGGGLATDAGFATTPLTNSAGDETNIPLSKGNTLALSPVDCNGGTGNAFEVVITNSKVDKQVSFNSCTDGKIKVI
ncbi:prepilin-type N-terminal cleavage/methylation domain-containing protein [Aliarcobacter butzleri]|uniref:type IV pilin protein n=1 Tax=Aliarcobacter butzleri TaxID=28197 RepID=UPI003450AF62